MLKREIKYEDFNGNQTSDSYYFNLSKPELIKMEVSHEQGLTGFIQRITEAKDHEALIVLFQELILLSYGQKSDDGKRFVKSDELRTEFSQTAAYDALFMELALDDKAAATFLKGALPQDMVVEIDKALATVPPTPIPSP